MCLSGETQGKLSSSMRFVNYVLDAIHVLMEPHLVSIAKSLHPDVCVLSVADFVDLHAFQETVQDSIQPSLLLVEEEHLDEVLSWLSETDDVCLLGSPPELVSHRVSQLGRKSPRVRDSLTDLMARQRFDQQLTAICLEANESRPLSLLLCDLDNFKKFNDQFGHSAGDEVICRAARVLKTFCLPSTTLGRLGGALFGIILESNVEQAMELAESIRESIKNVQCPANADVTASFGIASTHEPMDGLELRRRADQALFTAKANGRDCCVSFDEMQAVSLAAGNDVEVLGLENQARVLAERVANMITMRSRRLLSSARKEADIDGLTGCFNRRYLDRRLEAEFERAESHPLSVAFLDLDHFGQVNKQFGWPSGDKVLVEVCDTIRGNIRMTDWIGRYGGEEFCLVMPGTSLDSALIALNRIREAIASKEFFSTTNQLVPMTLSMGATCLWRSDKSYLELIDRTSQLALEAKRAGRNQIQIAREPQ